MVRLVAFLISTLFLTQQTPAPTASAGAEGSVVAPIDPTATDDDVEYVCPMDKDVRSKTPGKCPICGMTLVPGIPDPHEYPVHISTNPKVLKPGQETMLTMSMEDPDTGKPVHEFLEVHEKLYHFFLVSQDLTFFRHVHPEKQPNDTFKLPVNFPKAGLYRVLSDFYPKGGTPQLMTGTMLVEGAGFKLETPKLEPDLAPKHAAGMKDGKDVPGNLDVELSTEPPQPIVGEKTLLFFKVKPATDIELYLGAWAHMLAASSDLIDMIHEHPIIVTDPIDNDYKQLQFNLIFPRTGVYRVWVQMQRKGVVNTFAFNVPVNELK
jgi:hypothetical protein